MSLLMVADVGMGWCLAPSPAGNTQHLFIITGPFTRDSLVY